MSIAAACSLPAPLLAQSENQAAARALFAEGRRRMADGDYAKACPKFEAARDLYASTGVLLNLADCYEKMGRTASAWAAFSQAASVASRTDRAEDAAEAKRRQVALETRLVRMVLHVQARTPGLQVRRDGTEVVPASWDTPLPVDPGPHELRAEASGYVPFVKTIAMSDPGTTVTVDIPDLAAVAPPTAPPLAFSELSTKESGSPSGETSRLGETQRILGLTLAGAGVLGLGAASVLAIVAESEWNHAQGETGAARAPDSRDAGRIADAATVAVVVGSVVAATGVVLWLTAPTAPVAVGTNGRDLLVSALF
jgi:hypothetical protein